ncbi:MAG: hypothetical protein AB7I18_04820 [Candidatus Berkiella sp.]
MSKSKFEFYEVVKVNTKNKNLREIHNQRAVIVGKAREEPREWYYTIALRGDSCWCAYESDLESTGEFEKPDDTPRESIKVGVTKDGVGYVIDPESANDAM